MIALYVLTDPRDAAGATLAAIAHVLSHDATGIGFVCRHDDPVLAADIAALTSEHGAPCFAKLTREDPRRAFTDYVHVGALRAGDVAPRGIFTASAHDLEEAQRVANARAIFLGPIFDVPEKGPARGIELVTNARRALPSGRFHAIGGIERENVGACIAAGADGVAVIRAVMRAKEPGAVAEALVRDVQNALAAREED